MAQQQQQETTQQAAARLGMLAAHAAVAVASGMKPWELDNWAWGNAEKLVGAIGRLEAGMDEAWKRLAEEDTEAQEAQERHDRQIGDDCHAEIVGGLKEGDEGYEEAIERCDAEVERCIMEWPFDRREYEVGEGCDGAVGRRLKACMRLALEIRLKFRTEFPSCMAVHAIRGIMLADYFDGEDEGEGLAEQVEHAHHVLLKIAEGIGCSKRRIYNAI